MQIVFCIEHSEHGSRRSLFNSRKQQVLDCAQTNTTVLFTHLRKIMIKLRYGLNSF